MSTASRAIFLVLLLAALILFGASFVIAETTPDSDASEKANLECKGWQPGYGEKKCTVKGEDGKADVTGKCVADGKCSAAGYFNEKNEWCVLATGKCEGKKNVPPPTPPPLSLSDTGDVTGGQSTPLPQAQISDTSIVDSFVDPSKDIGAAPESGSGAKVLDTMEGFMPPTAQEALLEPSSSDHGFWGNVLEDAKSFLSAEKDVVPIAEPSTMAGFETPSNATGFGGTQEVTNQEPSWWESTWESTSQAASKAGNAVQDFASDAWEGTKSAAATVGDGFEYLFTTNSEDTTVLDTETTQTNSPINSPEDLSYTIPAPKVITEDELKNKAEDIYNARVVKLGQAEAAQYQQWQDIANGTSEKYIIDSATGATTDLEAEARAAFEKASAERAAVQIAGPHSEEMLGSAQKVLEGESGWSKFWSVPRDALTGVGSYFNSPVATDPFEKPADYTEGIALLGPEGAAALDPDTKQTKYESVGQVLGDLTGMGPVIGLVSHGLSTIPDMLVAGGALTGLAPEDSAKEEQCAIDGGCTGSRLLRVGEGAVNALAIAAPALPAIKNGIAGAYEFAAGRSVVEEAIVSDRLATLYARQAYNTEAIAQAEIRGDLAYAAQLKADQALTQSAIERVAVAEGVPFAPAAPSAGAGTSEAAFANVDDAIVQVRAAASDVKMTGVSDVDAAIAKLDDAVADVRAATADTRGSLASASDDVYANFDQAVADVRVAAGQGEASAAGSALDKAVASLDDAVADVRAAAQATPEAPPTIPSAEPVFPDIGDYVPVVTERWAFNDIGNQNVMTDWTTGIYGVRAGEIPTAAAKPRLELVVDNTKVPSNPPITEPFASGAQEVRVAAGGEVPVPFPEPPPAQTTNLSIVKNEPPVSPATERPLVTLAEEAQIDNPVVVANSVPASAPPTVTPTAPVTASNQPNWMDEYLANQGGQLAPEVPTTVVAANPPAPVTPNAVAPSTLTRISNWVYGRPTPAVTPTTPSPTTGGGAGAGGGAGGTGSGGGTPTTPPVAVPTPTNFFGQNWGKITLGVGGVVSLVTIGNLYPSEVSNKSVSQKPPPAKPPAKTPPAVPPPSAGKAVKPPPNTGKACGPNDTYASSGCYPPYTGSGAPYTTSPSSNDYCITSIQPVVVIPNTKPGPNCYNNPSNWKSLGSTMPPPPPAPTSQTSQTSKPATPPVPPPVTPPKATTTPAKPIATLIADPSTISSGKKTRLIWSSINTSSCELFAPDRFLMATGTTGSTSTPQLATSTRYTLDCRAPSGATTSAQTTVTVQ